MRLKIATLAKKLDKTARKFNVRKLDDVNCRKSFSLSLQNSFDFLQELEDEQMDETWVRIRSAYTKAREEVLVYTSAKKEQWISLDLWQAIE